MPQKHPNDGEQPPLCWPAMPARRRGRQPQRPERTTTRTVLFFRVRAGMDQDGQAIPYNIHSALQYVHGLQGSAERYLDESEDRVTCCWVDRLDRTPYRIRLGTVRRGDLPRVERDGRLRGLQLPEDSGLAE